MNETQHRDVPGPRTLAVVDWALDAGEAAAALARHAGGRGGRLGLLVPARLHGLDWAGDPRSSRPCAERQLAELQRLLNGEGLEIEAGWVGDPEMVPAVDEALAAWAADEVVLLGSRRNLSRRRPLAPARRVRSSTGLPVRPIRIAGPGARRRRRPHCDARGASPAGR